MENPDTEENKASSVRWKPLTKPGQVWLVLYECRLEAVRVSLRNSGFFAPGQEPLWGFENAPIWIKCLYDPDTEDEALYKILDTVP
jgi:hypothetical protein